MADDLGSLVLYRGRIKSSLTRLLTQTEEQQQQNWTYELVVSRMERLEDSWLEFRNSANQMYKFKDSEGYADPDVDFHVYEDKYVLARGNLYALKLKLEPIKAADNSDALKNLAEQQADFLNKIGVASSKNNDLPKINIPLFSGAYKDWPSFKDIFKSTIASKTSLSDTQKFHYLKSFLKDDAAKVIQHIPITEAAYKTAWLRLNDRYDRPKQIVNSFIETFMSLPSTSSENCAILRKIADGANEVIRGMDAIGHDERDCWLIYILLTRIDSETKTRWIQDSRNNLMPSIADFLEFLDNRSEELELCERKSTLQSKQGHSSRSTGNSAKCLVSSDNKSNVCFKCKSPDHTIYKCSSFISMPIHERRTFAKQSSLCYNCLRPGHSVTNCSSKGRCRDCGRRHNSLLHVYSANVAATALEVAMPTSTEPPTSSAAGCSTSPVTPWSSIAHIANPITLHATSNKTKQAEYIMPTALINVKNRYGKMVACRALLDCASKLSYITESCVHRLGLARSQSKILVSGISSVHADTTRGSCQINAVSRDSQHTLNAIVHILQNITTPLPTSSYYNHSHNLIKDIDLADPNYNISSPIDILFGLEHIWNIFTFDRRYDSHGKTIAVSTIFGWVVTYVETIGYANSAMALVSTVDIDRCLRNFWEIEEPDYKRKLHPDDAHVETHFKATHTRDNFGKYSVQLPFKIENPKFGNSLNGATCRFYAVERRLQKNPNLREKYVNFMREYESLGHMRQLNPSEIDIFNGKVFYLPHHPVLGEKIRVVFDGSFQDTNGVSLNDTLHIGPSIQRDLFSVCLRFRFHRYVFTADIVKMFRQIWIDDIHKNYQRIVWREDPQDEIKHYQLCTVTYGTTCAPYLSVRVLEQLATDYTTTHPIAAQMLLEDFYVDDVLTGAASEEEIVIKRNELVLLLEQAGLELRKWVSNSSRISVSAEDNIFLKGSSEDAKKVLGIYWKPIEDVLGYKINLKDNVAPTKRQVLSDVSRIFDPMGLLAPVVVNFKILLREIWCSNISWDETLPESLANRWIQWRNDLQQLQNFKIPRFVNTEINELELHGFSDASIQAYAAVIYSRYIDASGKPHICIIAAKSRVAPIKQKTLPQLELCGALLLVRLFKRIKEAMPHTTITARLWCDSTIVLSWLSQLPIKLKTFEANRTSEILDILPRNVWSHVASKENPADCASRGMTASSLLNFKLWWDGPDWLYRNMKYNSYNSINNFDILADPESLSALKPNAPAMVTTVDEINFLDELIGRISKWTKLVRIVAYICRFFHATKRHYVVLSNCLTFDEIQNGKLVLLKHAQNAFRDDRNQLQNNRPISTRSQLIKLFPFVDNEGLLRVGGRLRNSELGVEAQNPIILPKNSVITNHILEDLHERNLHPGVSALFVIVRQSFWILGARNLIRSLTHKCMKCFRQRQKMAQQLMADLPRVRVRQAFPFENTGCDYAGPFILKQYSGRNARKSKGYICLFVCLVTSAVHLELATDLSTECFLAALRRFISRRGKCRTIYSDNGGNFLGASRVLNEMHKQLMSQNHNETVSTTLAEDGIKWNFIPPLAPHYGGIWESAVRSIKMHFKRVVQNTQLTFEQMHTLLAQIEAVVNSRPLGAAPDTDCGYLSPAHFLIGRPYTMVPEGDLININPNRLDYWQHVQNMYQGFWRKWHQEYLTSLQQRPKWNQPQTNLCIGDIVVVKENNIPPAKWPMARILETFPGSDGHVRTVKLKTQRGEIVRHINKLARLPLF